MLLDFTANERFVDNQFDYNKCRLVFKADGQELHRKEYTREGAKAFHYEFDQDWKAGAHELVVRSASAHARAEAGALADVAHWTP